MEDRYLFKAKRKDNGEWVTGSLITCEDGTCKIATSLLEGKADEPVLVCAYEVDRDTICQCTGLKDKNGKLIWEKDIVRAKVGTAKVVWNKSEWQIEWLKKDLWRKDLFYWAVEDVQRIEVIGNIFDNPELLESEW
nr:MAG TPA: YopX protein [Caudoviricetes sp.]